MAKDQFEKGVAIILAALTQALTDRGIDAPVVSHDFNGLEDRPVAFVVEAAGQRETQSFSREEIGDSGQAIDAPSAIKVRMLVSRFIRQNA